MDLYIQPAASLEKSAAEVSLPEDANAWPNELMQELYKQVPYISDFEPHVVMDRVDAERGFGFGHVEVQNKTELQQGTSEEARKQVGINQVRIPVIIKDRKLLPLDLLVTAESKALPLTEGRLRQALFRPQAFDVTGRTPGDMSMVGQLYPPYRQNYGFGGGGVGMSAGMGKEGSVPYVTRERIWKQPVESLQKEAISARPILDAIKHETNPRRLDQFRSRMGDLQDKAIDGLKTYNRGRVNALSSTAQHAAFDRLRDLEKGAAGGEQPTEEHFHAKLEKVLGLQPADIEKLKSQQKEASSTLPNAVTNATKHTVKGIVPNIAQTLKLGSILQAILPTIHAEDYALFADQFRDPHLQAAFMKNASATTSSIQTLLNYNPVPAEKTAEALGTVIKPTVVQITKLAEGYQVKTANHFAWAPSERIVDRGRIVRDFGEKVALASDLTGSVTLTEGEGAKAGPEENRAEVVGGYGYYRVQTSEGEQLSGFVFPNLFDVDGTALPVSLFTDGTHAALQGEIVGERVTEDVPNLPLGEPSGGAGCFVRLLDGAAEATLPMTIKGGYQDEQGQKWHAETFDGRQIFVSLQPNLKLPVLSDDTALIPADYKWLPLGQAADIDLVSAPAQYGQRKEASRSIASVTVRAGGENNFSLDGYALRKVASEQKNFVSLDDALFLLGSCGTDLQYATEKLASALATSAPVQVKVGHEVQPLFEAHREATKLAAEHLATLPVLRCNLVKEAAFIPDPVAVDTVLSLGFINPENMQVFVSYLPQIDQVQSKLCEILIAARLGLANIPASSLEKTVRSLEETIDGLKTLAFSRS